MQKTRVMLVRLKPFCTPAFWIVQVQERSRDKQTQVITVTSVDVINEEAVCRYNWLKQRKNSFILISTRVRFFLRSLQWLWNLLVFQHSAWEFLTALGYARRVGLATDIRAPGRRNRTLRGARGKKAFY